MWKVSSAVYLVFSQSKSFIPLESNNIHPTWQSFLFCNLRKDSNSQQFSVFGEFFFKSFFLTIFSFLIQRAPHGGREGWVGVWAWDGPGGPVLGGWVWISVGKNWRCLQTARFGDILQCQLQIFPYEKMVYGPVYSLICQCHPGVNHISLAL